MQRPGNQTPEFSPQNRNGKYLKLQIVRIQREHMVNRVSSSFSVYYAKRVSIGYLCNHKKLAKISMISKIKGKNH